uniref:Glomulin n=1 Tax=Graphocephala atropunctata TaxID=36148 RepID=A0A1B6L4U0_9HEMI
MAVEVEVDLVEHLSDLLASGDTRSVKAMINESAFETVLRTRANDVIPIVSYYINEEAMQENPAVFRYSEKVLQKCAESGNPKECLMEYLAQIESLDVIKFKICLKPIQTTLLRIPDRKSPLMQCVFNAIYTLINSLPLPRYRHLDEKSKLLLDCDEDVQRIRDIYSLIVMFYEPFVNEISDNSSADKRTKSVRQVLLQALLQLLGNPIVHVDLKYNETESSTLSRLVFKIVAFILKLQSDPLALLLLVENEELVSVDEERAFVHEFSSNEIKFSDLSLSSFFYLILCENMCKSFHYVYNKQYVYHNCLRLAKTLLRYKETLVLQKGLLLAKVMMEQIEAGSMDFTHLASSTHKEIIELLSNIAVYHKVKEDRRLAAELIKKHFCTFDVKGQFYILLNVCKNPQHPNITGYFTTFFTDSVRKTFINEEYIEYFTGKRLFDLLCTFCLLIEGVETDLIENKDQILSALNLIIFLTRRDRNNFSGVWKYITSISKTFLDPLREAVDLSRAHYKLQLRSLDDPLKTEDEADLFVSVGGQMLDQMSTEDKQTILNAGLTVFDLIEHLLSRANECVADKPQL